MATATTPPPAEVESLAPERSQGRAKATIALQPSQVQPIYDYLTLPLTAELRDRATALATQLQRRRTNREERITTSVVYRVAIETFLDCFRLEEAAAANNEMEFRAAARKVFSKLLKQSA
jgi:hypothetical protein